MSSTTGPLKLTTEHPMVVEEMKTNLSQKDMDVIRSLDSRSFGFLNLASEEAVPSSSATLSSFMSRDFIKKGIVVLQSELTKEGCTDFRNLHTLCQIGHLHLLLEQYSEALSAYQSYSQLCPDSSLNIPFLYGLALVYFAYGEYNWSLSAFQKVLYNATDFARLSEIHIRIAMIYKEKEELKKAMDHFSQAYASSGPCSMSKLESHLYYLKGDNIHAKHCFETILASKNVPNQIKALALRQLGWLYHTVPSIASKNECPQVKAIELLKLAVGSNPSCGQAWYFLGRCHTSQNQYKEAFMSYRQSISKLEKQPDTWCAIGILYQQMGQARDSLQAYITAIYFDINHTATWTDLGLLYESCGHLIDSLLCYKNGLASLERKPKRRYKRGRDAVSDVLFSRHSFIEHHIQQTGGVAIHSAHSRPTLPSLQESWDTLVPSHIKLSSPPTETPIFHLPLSPNVPSSPLLSPSLSRMGGPSLNKRYKIPKSKDPIILKNINEGWIGNHHISPSQTYPYSPSFNLPSTTNDISSFNSCFSQLDSILPPPSMDPYNHQTPPPYENTIVYYPNTTQSSSNNMYTNGILDPYKPVATNEGSGIDPFNLSAYQPAPPSQITPPPFSQNFPFSPDPFQTSPVGISHNTSSSVFSSSSSPFNADATLNRGHAHQPHPPLEFQNRWGSSLNVLGKRSCDSGNIMRSPKMVATSPTTLMAGEEHQITTGLASPSCYLNGFSDSRSVARPSSLFISSGKSQVDTHIPAHSGGGTGSGHLSDTSSGVSSTSAKFSTSSDHSSTSSSPCFVSSPFPYPSPNLKDHQMLRLMCPIHQPHPGLADDEEYMKDDPFRPPSPSSVLNELHPKVPLYNIESYDENDLHTFCTNANEVPICIIKGLPNATNFDLSLFSSATLMKDHGDHEVEVREQILQAADKNYDSLGKKQIWKCESNRSLTTVKEYGEYQMEFLKDETLTRKMLKFGTNCDLSDQEKWSTQLNEIKKLPKFLQVKCPEANFLNHVGHTVLGMNTVQLYMKVPGCRTPGHQENNNFCSVNINIGPGDCEWFAVPNKYWGKIHELCEKHKISFLVGSWWPILDELEQHQIPVYRFTQYKGEIVWINPGTVHWVQANSACNNIAWNVGPMTAHQLRIAWERYQWNKLLKVRSIVPMMTLTWNFARNVKVFNSNMFQQISSLLHSSYKQCEQLLQLLETLDIPVTWHGHIIGEPTPTCTLCLEEVFNILFVSTNKKGEHLVYCHKCIQQLQIKSKKQPFTVLQQYAMSELKKIMDKFQPKNST